MAKEVPTEYLLESGTKEYWYMMSLKLINNKGLDQVREQKISVRKIMRTLNRWW